MRLKKSIIRQICLGIMLQEVQVHVYDDGAACANRNGIDLEPVKYSIEQALINVAKALSPVVCDRHQSPGHPRKVYFPQTSVISLVVELNGGDVIETAMLGSDNVVNASAALDGMICLNKCVVRIAGVAVVIDVGPLREIARVHERFCSLLLRHEQVRFAHV